MHQNAIKEYEDAAAVYNFREELKFGICFNNHTILPLGAKHRKDWFPNHPDLLNTIVVARKKTQWLPEAHFAYDIVNKENNKFDD